jgi:phosphate-selective porin OprO/OprP
MRTKTSLYGAASLGALLALALGASVQAQETTTAWKGAPQFANDGVTFKVRGRILIDGVFQEVDREGSGVDFETRNFRGRQVFLGVEGQLNSFFFYKAEGGAVNGGAWQWDDVVIEYKPNDFTSIMVGNIKAAGLENLTSTRFTTFMDRGPFGEFGPDSYLTSAVVKLNGQNWTVTGAVQGDSINNADVTAAAAGTGNDMNERLGFTARASFAPILTDTTKVHLAVWARQRDHGNEAAFAYSSRPNTAVATIRPINSGALADNDQTWGVEAAGVFGSVSAQAEYADIKFDRFCANTLTPVQCAALGQDGDITVGYAFVSFWPTGEMRNYDPLKGEFGRPKILSPVTAGGFGGVELALRYDFADLTEANNGASATQDAGEYTAWTAGINYYPTGYVRVQANYTKSETDNPGSGRDLDADTLQFRAQLDF